MRKMKKLVSLLAAAVLCFTSIPFNGITVQAADVTTADAVVRLTPGEASPFNDTNGDGFGEFEGWGTSLCWWANRVGYSEALVEQAAEKFFSDKGLDMNIGRYNIGGGDLIGTMEATPDVEEFRHNEHIIRSDSGVPGYSTNVTKMDLENNTLEYYQENFAATDVESGYAWDYDWDADANQINILKAAIEASGEFHAEAFSNSPPYWMTVSGCSSGNTSASRDNLRPECYTAFATYMADVIKHWNDEGVINFQSASPMNEPDSSYWSKNSNKQEGCHFENGASQSKILVALDKALKDRGIDLILAGTDETSIDVQITSYNTLTDEAKAVVERIDTHTYGGSNRAGLNALAQEVNKNLWMSEVDGDYKAGSNAGQMSAALGLAQQMIKDLNGLESSAWILWNAIDMHVDSSEYGQKWVNARSANDFLTVESMENSWRSKSANGYWGLTAADHDNEEIILSMKYYGFGQLSRYIRPGDTLIKTSDAANVLAAYDFDENKVVIVTTNTTAQDKVWKFDLSLFNEISEDAKVTAIRTSGDIDTGEHWADVSDSANIVLDAKSKAMTADLKANSITTYVIEGIEFDPENPVTGGSVEIELTEDMIEGSDPYVGTGCDATASNPAENAIDNNFNTFFDGVENGYIIIDLGEATDIASVGYAPRSGYADRCTGAVISGSNDGQNWETLYTVPSAPAEGVITEVLAEQFVTGNSEYQYIKYSVGADGFCNISEIKVFKANYVFESMETVSAVVAEGRLPELPAKVKGITTTGEEKEVSVKWDLENADFASLDVFETTEVFGTVSGNNIVPKAEVMLVPKKLEYLIDCHNPYSTVWSAVKDNVDTLLNTGAPDQAKTDDNTWGYTFVPGEDAEHWDYDMGNDLYGYGYWAYSNKNITYDVTLPAGEHTVTVGGFDFWNGRTENIYYSVNGGEKQLVCRLTLNHNSGTKASGTITVPEDDSVVTISVEKYRNSDPILGFIAINNSTVENYDYSALEAAIVAAEEVSAEGYTEVSYAELEAALKEAKIILNNAYNQEEIDEAAKALEAAIDGLRKPFVIEDIVVNTTVIPAGQYPNTITLTVTETKDLADLSADDFAISGKASAWLTSSLHNFTATVSEVALDGNVLTLTFGDFPEKYVYVDNYTVTCNAYKDLTFTVTKDTTTITPIADEFEQIREEANGGFDYNLFTPEDTSKPQPIVLAFHGYGDNENLYHNKLAVAWADPKNQEERPSYVLAPMVSNYRTASYRTELYAKVVAKVQEMVEEGKVDPNRIYVTGKSYGGGATYEFLINYPEFAAGAIAMCGETGSPYGNIQDNLATIKDVPLWIAHATGDPTVSVSDSRNAYNALVEAGSTVVKFSEYSNEEMTAAGVTSSMGNHSMEAVVLEDVAYMEWLFAQVKSEVVEPELNYTALEAAIADAKALDKEAYTEESYAALEEAVAAAEALLNNAETQEAIDEATAAIAAAVEALDAAPEPSTKVEDIFSDVLGDYWYTDAIQYVYDNEIMTGNEDGTFTPEVDMTRAMMVTTLYRIEGSPEVEEQTALAKFTDAEEGMYYVDALSWASDNGIANGYDYQTIFGVDHNVTREQVATFLYRYAQFKGYEVNITADISEYVGAEDVSEYAQEAMEWAVGTGLISGIDKWVDGEQIFDLAPQGNATRAQLATILMRFCERY